MNIGDPIRTIRIEPVRRTVPEREERPARRFAPVTPPTPVKDPEKTPAKTPSKK